MTHPTSDNPAKTVAVYCGSSARVAPACFAAARALGAGLGARGWGLVYGGTDTGMMGAVAAALAAGARVTGVAPRWMIDLGIAQAGIDELVAVGDMRERKAAMEARADAFVALPGGLGTLEELFEMLTLKQLGVHAKPVVLIDTEGFYRPLLAMMDHLHATGFTSEVTQAMFEVVPNAEAALAAIECHVPTEPPSKWV